VGGPAGRSRGSCGARRTTYVLATTPATDGCHLEEAYAVGEGVLPPLTLASVAPSGIGPGGAFDTRHHPSRTPTPTARKPRWRTPANPDCDDPDDVRDLYT
jgi:hypothetical protein